MYPYITLFGKSVSSYALMAVFGGAVATIFSLLMCKKDKSVSLTDLFFSLIYAVIGCWIGAKLLYILISVDTYWLADKVFEENIYYWLSILMTGGFVFYGGLAGAVIGILIYCHRFKISFRNVISIITPSIALFHAFGRTGCFLGGCCYGIEYHGFLSVTYSLSPIAPKNIPLFPVQLVEVALNLVICIVLTYIFLNKAHKISTFGVYLVLYPPVRFILEFFRGDLIRGFIGFLSVSQWISIFLFAFGILILLKYFKSQHITRCQ